MPARKARRCKEGAHTLPAFSGVGLVQRGRSPFRSTMSNGAARTISKPKEINGSLQRVRVELGDFQRAGLGIEPSRMSPPQRRNSRSRLSLSWRPPPRVSRAHYWTRLAPPGVDRTTNER